MAQISEFLNLRIQRQISISWVEEYHTTVKSRKPIDWHCDLCSEIHKTVTSESTWMENDLECTVYDQFDGYVEMTPLLIEKSTTFYQNDHRPEFMTSVLVKVLTTTNIHSHKLWWQLHLNYRIPSQLLACEWSVLLFMYGMPSSSKNTATA